MNNFFKSKKLKKYWLEIILITISTTLTITSFLIYQQSKQAPDDKIITTFDGAEEKTFNKIFVDVSGSVNSPGLYEASTSSRIKGLVDLAGGLSDSADRGFFARNFNLARLVSDQEKIYVPSVWEINMGYFIEGQTTTVAVVQAGTININEATLEELDTLPGVGKVTAQKIIDNRPYGALQELIDNKVISQNMLEKLNELIEI